MTDPDITDPDITDPASPDWDEIRHRYEETDDRIRDICADARIGLADLDRARRREQWRRQKPRPFGPRANPAHVPSPLGERVRVRGATQSELAQDSARAATTTSDQDASTPDDAQRIAARRRLLHRLVAAITLKLTQLERQMTNSLDTDAADGATTATDHERETRAIGALIDNLEKIMEMESGLSNPSGRRGPAASDAAADLADEAERCRRELADRLTRIVEAAAGEA